MDTRDDEDYVAYVSARVPALKRLAYLLCGGDDRANDLVQESLTRLYIHWRTARNADNLDRYVRAIVVRAHIDETRRGWFNVRLFGAVPEPRSHAPVPDVDTAAVLSDALSRLPAGQRAVLVLRFLCDMPIDEVANVLGCSTGTVKSQTSHGLAKLRDQLNSHDFATNAKES